MPPQRRFRGRCFRDGRFCHGWLRCHCGQPQPAADEIRHDLRGCDDGESFAVQAQPAAAAAARLEDRLRRRAPAPISRVGAIRLREPRLEPAGARLIIIKPGLQGLRRLGCFFGGVVRLRAFCGASSARSSICAYSCL